MCSYYYLRLNTIFGGKPFRIEGGFGQFKAKWRVVETTPPPYDFEQLSEPALENFPRAHPSVFLEVSPKRIPLGCCAVGTAGFPCTESQAHEAEAAHDERCHCRRFWNRRRCRCTERARTTRSELAQVTVRANQASSCKPLDAGHGNRERSRIQKTRVREVGAAGVRDVVHRVGDRRRR